MSDQDIRFDPELAMEYEIMCALQKKIQDLDSALETAILTLRKLVGTSPHRDEILAAIEKAAVARARSGA